MVDFMIDIGGIAAETFKDNKNYIAICKSNGEQATVSLAKNRDHNNHENILLGDVSSKEFWEDQIMNRIPKNSNINCIGNPPYGAKHSGTKPNLHYDIALQTLQYVTNASIQLMPVTMLTRSFDTKYDKYKKEFDKYLTQVEYKDSKENFPDTHMKTIGIWTFDKNKKKNSKIEIIKLDGTKVKVKSLFDYNERISVEELSILEKFSSKNQFDLWDQRCKPFRYCDKKIPYNEFKDRFLADTKFNEFKYFICVSLANGEIDAQWQTDKLKNYGIFNLTKLKEIINEDSAAKTFIGFKEDEFDSANSFYELLNSKSFKFILAKMQDDQSMVGRIYKFMPNVDFSNLKNDKDLYKYFNISDEEQKIIEEIMAQYEAN